MVDTCRPILMTIFLTTLKGKQIPNAAMDVLRTSHWRDALFVASALPKDLEADSGRHLGV